MPTNPYQPNYPTYQAPQQPMPSFQQQTAGMGTDANYGNVIGAIQRAGSVPGMTQTAMPAIQALLAPGGQRASGYEQAISNQTSQNVSAAQSDAMRRGITGSSMEMASMGGARAAGQQNLAQFYSQTANQLSQHMYNAFQGDKNQQVQSLMALAQAMGQELTSQRDIEMFREQLRMGMEQAGKNRNSAMFGSIISGAGSIIGGIYGGPAGYAAGKAAGSAVAGEV